MSDDLDKLCDAYGVALTYEAEGGARVIVSASTRRGLLAAMGVAAGSDDEVRESLRDAPEPPSDPDLAAIVPAFVPDWLNDGRTWGVTCQLYSVRSARNHGIGDFEDLGRLAEICARAGADFLGVNPLHAPFLAEPGRFSPYAPSSRRFLNPFYIAIDRLEGAAPDEDPETVEHLRAETLVDYAGVVPFKRRAFEHAFELFRSRDFIDGLGDQAEFRSFCDTQGEALQRFALFEAISEAVVADGGPAGWHDWPEPMRTQNSDAVDEFASKHAERIAFHSWLQWVADRQLADAQRRALAAGMRIGIKFDLAVGVAADGADTWTAPDVVLPGASVGAPPDNFNMNGQDWGLAPVSPISVGGGDGAGFSQTIRAAMRYGGALRIDHVMALKRLYLIPSGTHSKDGGYVAYPFDKQLAALTAASRETGTLIVGEDLGTVPPDFREYMRAADIQGYRVMVFEREDDGELKLPGSYPREALACVATHDLPTLAGWWTGRDIVIQAAIGGHEPEIRNEMEADRTRERHRLIDALRRAGVLTDHQAMTFLDQVRDGRIPDDLDDDLATAIHCFSARTPCRLVAVQIEDLLGMQEAANVPGTTDEHPNWRRKLSHDLDDIAAHPRFVRITEMLRDERGRGGAS
jgi:4-alpha-glucanotransferase